MGDIYSELFDSKKKEFVQEDEQIKKIEKLEDPEELEEALKILEEKIEGKSETKGEPSKEDEDTSSEEKSEPDNKDKKSDTSDKDKTFTLTEEVIAQHPEEVRDILSKYKDKTADDIANAIANAIVMKSPYLKGNDKVIAQIKEDFKSKSPDELIDILIDTQKQVGKSDNDIEIPAKENTETQTVEVEEDTFPEIPEDEPNIKQYLEKETLARLKSKYPNMPDITSMDSEEYKEWRRDLDIDNPDNNFREDLKMVKESVKQDISKIIFIQENLNNLYDNNPSELIPLVTKENLPKLKQLNNDPLKVFVEDLQDEIKSIKESLKKYNLTEEDLGIDLTIKFDENGYPTNEYLDTLLIKDKLPDGTPVPNTDIVGIKKGRTRDYIYWLKKGQLVKNFKDQYEDKILTAFFEKKAGQESSLRNKLKKETLKEGSGRSTPPNKKVYTLDDIEKIDNPEVLNKIVAELEK